MVPLIVLGCGYVGERLARAALAAGRPVRVCARSTGRLAPLAAVGAEVKYLDASVPKQLGPALSGMSGATIVYSIPPVTALPPGQSMRAALQAAYGAGAGCFIHFSSSGLYGAQPDDDAWIDEDTPLAHDDPAMANVQTDEAAIDACTFDRLRTVILRLAPVYGPGRGMRARLRDGKFRILENGQHATSRIHVDDVIRIVFAAESRATKNSRYLVADDEPTTQGTYARWLCDRMGVAMPPSREMFTPGGARVTHRNRRIRNTRVKTELAIELRYPSCREGEAAIEIEEGYGSQVSDAPGIREVLTFWFGEPGAEDAAAKRWFTRDELFDEEIRRRFGATVELATSGALDDWAATPPGTLALVVLLDQFSRNLYRDSAQAFASDARALALSRSAITRGEDRDLSFRERYMLSMPLMHAEDPQVQRESLTRFATLVDEAEQSVASASTIAMLRAALDYAHQHADIVERFGRFPHRNKVLSRPSTPEEIEFLSHPGSGF